MEIRELKEAYRIPAAWRDLGLPGEPGKNCRSPFPGEHRNGDANPSFSIFADGTRWKDFSTGESGSVIDLIVKARGCDMAEAICFVKDHLGIQRPERKPDTAQKPTPKIPPLRQGTEAELHELGERRGFSTEALRLAQRRGLLYYTTLWGHDAWCVTDPRHALFEFRRTDGCPWDAYGRLPQRKSHCVGRGKNWPLGLPEAAQFEKIAFCEGAPDFLAAHHFAVIENKNDSLGIVCVLGASNHTLAPEALAQFKGKLVCFYPHIDDAGRTAVRAWAQQLKDAGAARVTAFDLSGIVTVSGEVGKDLADAARLSADAFESDPKWTQVLP